MQTAPARWQPADGRAVSAAALASFAALRNRMGEAVIGQPAVIEALLIALLADGHVLLEGLPGLAKTRAIKALGRALRARLARVQFTPDLLPSDLIGAEVYRQGGAEGARFVFQPGPIFAPLVLADEINRAPAKVQSALLEAMEERQVTVAGQTHALPQPFLVMATQNPIEQEGTYPLPEAQLDRFMFNIQLDYPNHQQEVEIVKKTTTDSLAQVNTILTGDEIMAYQHLVRRVPVADNVVEYAVKLSQQTRPGPNGSSIAKDYLEWGAGPRASQFLVLGAKCHALLNGKYSPDIEDVQAVARPVLRHRIVRNFKAEAEGITVDQLIDKLMI